jgi:lipopolysaccharide export system ATP-binding protein
MTEPLLVVRGLTKAFAGRRVLDALDLEVRPGEVAALLGPNGAGKTTAFRIVAGLLRPDAGTVELAGPGGRVDLAGQPLHRRAASGLGYLPQEPSVLGGLSVVDNVVAVLEATDCPRRERRARAEALVAEYGLSGVARSRAWSLSGGERRRLEVARVLARSPRVLLLDEPFAGLDPRAAEELLRLVRGLAGRGLGVLFTDHHVQYALSLADRVQIVAAGKVVAAGTPDEVLRSGTAREVYLGGMIGPATPATPA